MPSQQFDNNLYTHTYTRTLSVCVCVCAVRCIVSVTALVAVILHIKNSKKKWKTFANIFVAQWKWSAREVPRPLPPHDCTPIVQAAFLMNCRARASWESMQARPASPASSLHPLPELRVNLKTFRKQNERKHS